MAVKKAEKSGGLEIHALKTGRVKLRIIGNTPLYFNAMSVKAMRTLLVGGGKKTAAEKREIKHDPEAEFRASVYKTKTGPTLLCFPAPGIKSAMSTAALETAGVTKSSVQRLIFLPEAKVKIWGKPFLKMDVVRSADMNRTPDVRTRAFLPQWCSEIDIQYVQPTLSKHSVFSLLTNAGIMCGIGDFRQEKGKGSFGTFSVYADNISSEDQEIWDEITKQGRDVQQAAMDAAMDQAECYDEETEALMEFLVGERIRRAA